MSKGRVLAIICVWSVIIVFVALIYRFAIVPFTQKVEAKAQEKETQEKLKVTSADSRYDSVVDLALDSFSAYCVFRSNDFKNELAQDRIGLNVIDDGADYAQRIQMLNDGKYQFALFTLDTLIKNCANINALPGVVVSIIDETRGADAMLAYKETIPNIDTLNSSDVEIILTGNSPSETFVQVVATHFNLQKVKDFKKVDGAKAVYDIYRKSNLKDKKAYVLWQPFVSKMLENPNVHVLIDSSKFRGYIVDVLVVNRDFLYKNPKVVEQVVTAYFKTKFKYTNAMPQLILDDAKLTGEGLSKKQAEDLVNGIWWKNTQENYAHFGVNPNSNIQHIEDMISNITRILLESNVISNDPTNGKFNLLYNDKVLKNVSNNLNLSEFISEKTLPQLSDDEWNSLLPIGTLEVPEIQFARGTNKINSRSKLVLDELAKKLETFPNYYVMIKGNASSIGNAEANQALALNRAKAVEKYLLEKGISNRRLKAVQGNLGESSVSFVLGQISY